MMRCSRARSLTYTGGMPRRGHHRGAAAESAMGQCPPAHMRDRHSPLGWVRPKLRLSAEQWRDRNMDLIGWNHPIGCRRLAPDPPPMRAAAGTSSGEAAPFGHAGIDRMRSPGQGNSCAGEQAVEEAYGRILRKTPALIILIVWPRARWDRWSRARA